MVNEKMRGLGACRSVIRELFEYGKQRKAQIGAENVFDFSIGNPSVPSPAIVNDTLTRLLQEKDAVSLHGYTSAQGDAGVRKAIADYIAKTHNANPDPDLIYLTVGAAASLTITLNAIVEDGDEVIAFAPFFPEYNPYVNLTGAVLKIVPPNTADFQINFEAFEEMLTPDGVYKAKEAALERLRKLCMDSPILLWRQAYKLTKHVV